MKKVLAICLAMVMVASIGVTVFAAPDNFTSSPSGNTAPTIIEAKNESPDCTADVVVAAYVDRENATGDIKKQLDDAFNELTNASNLIDLCPALEAAAKAKNVATTSLAVSDIFDIHHEGCAEHDHHGSFTLTLSSETFKNFVALLHYNNGKWEVIENATLSESDGKYLLNFTVDNFSPFAIVVNKDAGESTNTGDTNNTVVIAIVLAAAAAAVVLFTCIKRKKKNV